jgi:exportin-T
MQIIENYLKTRYKTSTSQADQVLLRQFMSNWLQLQMNRKANEKNFLTKKVAQLFAIVSLIDFPNRWPSFFIDLVATAQWSIGNADFYLKVLEAIDSEIVDRELPRTNEEQLIITFYKDSIRERCVNELVESWFLLLKDNTIKNPEITCQTLDIIGAYISWIDINLIVNSRFVEFFVFGLSQIELRETTCTCLEEVINKRMEVRAKLKLVDYLWKDVLQTSAISLEQQINLSNVNNF